MTNEKFEEALQLRKEIEQANEIYNVIACTKSGTSERYYDLGVCNHEVCATMTPGVRQILLDTLNHYILEKEEEFEKL